LLFCEVAGAADGIGMISYSEVQQFRRCQRQWFFKNVFASAVAKKDPQRREAYVLSKLQSLSAWRGSLVDRVISTYLLPELRRRSLPSFDSLLSEARRLFEMQRAFATAHRVREDGMRVSANQDAFAALLDVENGNTPDSAAFDLAWHDVETSLRNALGMQDLFADLRSANVIVQARLFFDINDVKVAANPDVVAFRRNRTIRIVDWKVHSFGLRAAKSQLTVYACALHRGQRQSYFAWDSTGTPLSGFALTEVQLINGEVHDYTVNEQDLDEMVDDLFESGELIELACGEKTEDDMRADEFPVTNWPEMCPRCGFRRICKEGTS
jgi:hypothetical protein